MGEAQSVRARRFRGDEPRPVRLLAGVGAPNDPKSIGESQQYLRDFSRVVETEATVEDIVKAMLALHPRPRQRSRRVALRTGSCQEARAGLMMENATRAALASEIGPSVGFVITATDEPSQC
jgi:hypothetical protein